MEKLTYVTGNYGKYVSVREKFEKNGLEIEFANIDLNEPDINDISFISIEKAKFAYEIIKSPVFVVDSGFYIRSYPGKPYYPGAFVKRSGVSNNIDNLLDKMKDVQDRYAYFLDCLTYYDGENIKQFYGKSEGVISFEKKGNELKQAKSNLWYVFIPKNSTKTLAQMSDLERNNRCDDRSDATLEFINWLKNNKKLIKKL